MGLKIFGFAAVLAFGTGIAATNSLAKQVIEIKQKTCRIFTEKVEREQGIPRHLLAAISLVETGRYSREKGGVFAWPWTVTAKGKGLYFKNKAEAVATVGRLQKSGVTNIDVGCMQISLHYHPRAFANLEEAFDPVANVAYAARFLKGLHGQTQSWPQAAANYHSSNPLRNESYKAKVLRLWQRIGGGALANLGPMAAPDPAYMDPASHASLKALLNARFRARLEAERGASKQARSLAELDQWRRTRMGPNYRAQTAALRRANTARHLRKELTKGKTSFAAKRRLQLATWRRDRSANPFGRIKPR